MKVAIMPVCMRMQDPYEAMRTAAQMGVEGIHLTVDWADFSLDEMTTEKCNQVRAFVEDLGLEISAVSGSSGDLGESADKCVKLEKARRSLEVARDLGCGIWQSHIGIVPADKSDPRWSTYVDLLRGIAALGEQIGACLAIETGPEPPRVLAELIQEVGSDAIRINFDPANLIIWPALLAQRNNLPYDKAQAFADFDPIAGVRLLMPYIVHTHVKDARVSDDGQYQEVPPGEGMVDWPAYIQALRNAGYDGYFAIERESGPDPVGDMRRTVQFLRGL